MGMVFATMKLTNLEDKALAARQVIGEEEIRSLEIPFLVDSGSYMMAINEQIQTILQLPLVEFQHFRIADDRIEKYPVVGPLELEYRGLSYQKAILEEIES